MFISFGIFWRIHEGVWYISKTGMQIESVSEMLIRSLNLSFGLSVFKISRDLSRAFHDLTDSDLFLLYVLIA